MDTLYSKRLNSAWPPWGHRAVGLVLTSRRQK